MSTKIRIPFIDYSDENSAMDVYADPAVSDLNITALFDAVVAVTLGNAQKSALRVETDKDAGTAGRASVETAQRETKWRVVYTDDVNGRRGSFEIPCADLTGHLVAGTDTMDIGVGTDGADLVAAVETACLSRDDNAITVQKIEFVGRST